MHYFRTKRPLRDVLGGQSRAGEAGRIAAPLVCGPPVRVYGNGLRANAGRRRWVLSDVRIRVLDDAISDHRAAEGRIQHYTRKSVHGVRDAIHWWRGDTGTLG